MPGGPTKRTPLGILPPNSWKRAGVAEKSDDFAQVFFGFFDAGDVLKGDFSAFLVQQFGFRAPKPHSASACALHLAHKKDPNADQNQHGEPIDENIQEAWTRIRRVSRNGDARLREEAYELWVLGSVCFERRVVSVLACDVFFRDLNGHDLAVLDGGEELAIGNFLAFILISAAAQRA